MGPPEWDVGIIMTTVFRGAKAPEALAVTILRGKSTLDLMTVTAVTLVVRDDAGVERTWTTAISGKTSTELIATRVFESDGSDVPIATSYRVMPHLAVPGGTRRCEPFTLQVQE
jgi:hypothetical protein